MFLYGQYKLCTMKLYHELHVMTVHVIVSVHRPRLTWRSMVSSWWTSYLMTPHDFSPHSAPTGYQREQKLYHVSLFIVTNSLHLYVPLSLSLSPLYCPQTPFPRTFPASSLPPFLPCLHSPYATVLQPWWLHQGVCQQEGPPHSLPGAHDKGIYNGYF